MPILNIFLIIGVVALFASFFIKGKSAIWGGATLGLIVGIIYGFIKSDFSDILRAILLGADVGLATIILSFIGNSSRKR